MEEQRYNSIHTGQQIDQAVTWLLAHANDQIFGGGVSEGTIATPDNPTYWLASAGTYTCGTNTFTVPQGGVGIISYANNQWSCMTVGGMALVNNLREGGTDKALTAEMGKSLYQFYQSLISQMGNKMSKLDVSSLQSASSITGTFHDSIATAISNGNYLYTTEGVVANATTIASGNVIQLTVYKGATLRFYTLSKDSTSSNVSHDDVNLQQALVSGTTIKTVNGQSLLGSGNVAVQERLISGTNIKTINNQSLLGGGNITIQGGSGGGGIEFVEFETHADMEEDSHQPEGTIGYVSDEGTFYACYRGDWSQLTKQGCDISWVFEIDDDVDVSVYTKLRYLASYGMPMSADGCPVMVDVDRNGVLFCKMGSNVWNFVNIFSNGQVRGYTEPAPAPLLKTTISGATPTQALAPNTFYQFGSVTSLTVTLTAGHALGANIYAFRFTAGVDDPTITLPQGVVINQDLSLKTGDVCEFSIQDNLALFSVWEAS